MKRVPDERQDDERRQTQSPTGLEIAAAITGMPDRMREFKRKVPAKPVSFSSRMTNVVVALTILSYLLRKPYALLHHYAKFAEWISLSSVLYTQAAAGRAILARSDPNNSPTTRFLALIAYLGLVPAYFSSKLIHFICQATISPVRNVRIAYAYITQHSEAEVKAAVHYDPVTDTLTVPPVAIDRNAEQTRAFHMALLSLLTTVIFGSLTFYYLPPLAKIVLLASVVAHVSGIGLEKLIPTLKAALSAYAQSRPQQNQPLESEVSNTHASKRVVELVEDLDEADRATQQAAAVVNATAERAENDDAQRAPAGPAPAAAEAPRVVQRLHHDYTVYDPDQLDQMMAGW